MSVALNHSFSAVHMLCFTFLIVALDFVLVKYSSISYSYYWIPYDIFVLCSTLKSSFIMKILVLKVLFSVNSPCFPNEKYSFLSSSRFLLIWPPLVLEGWKFVFKEGGKWQKLCVIWICQTLWLCQLPLHRSCVQSMEEVKVRSLRCGVGYEPELWEHSWGRMGLDLGFWAAFCSSAFLTQYVNGHWGCRWFLYHGMFS